ncbi:hypothetical protein GUJ93_ZPchr0003g17750 [Zizania palustris]|uniref:Uncharacterized protein n=1 Tax=Zizania palustris TaxID=103762 RepID=A0A8J5RWB5_ZIZPA|nr:hypothetical protein GUJ93_ZPchr0003g17750 [Zizania palustris]
MGAATADPTVPGEERSAMVGGNGQTLEVDRVSYPEDDDVKLSQKDELWWLETENDGLLGELCVLREQLSLLAPSMPQLL